MCNASTGLLDAEAPEIPQLHHLTLARVERFECEERVVERHETRIRHRTDKERVIQRHSRYAAAPFLAALRARRIDQDPSHRPRRHRKEVGAVLPADLIDLDQAQVGFVHERRRLQRVPRPLPAHVMQREPAQLLVDQRDQPVEGIGLASTPGKEECRGAVGWLHG